MRNTVDHSCISAAISLTVNPPAGPPAVPIASVTIQPTCAIPTGTIEVTAPLGANLEYSIDGIIYQTSPLFAGLTANTYSVTVRNTGDRTCLSPVTSLIVDPPAGIPSAPTASVTIQPTCALPTGTIVVTAPLGANLEYSIDGIIYKTSPLFAGLAPNAYSVTVRRTNDSTCVSPASSLTVELPEGVPVAPTASVTIQPTCALPTGTIEVTAPLGIDLEYSVDSITYQVSPLFAGLTPNIYSVTLRRINDPTCISPATILTVNPPVDAPAAPIASVILQPTCTIPTGTIEVTAPLGIIYEYSIDGNTWQVSPLLVGLAPNTYSVTVRRTNDPSCVSPATNITVNPPAGISTAPIASVTLQPTCAIPSGTIEVTAPLGVSYEYSIDPNVWQASPLFSGLTPNTYSVTVRNAGDHTCISPATSLIVDPPVCAPAAPIEGIHQLSSTWIIWNWNSVTDADGYKWSTSNDYGSAIDVFTNTSYNETGLAPDTAFTRYVWAYNSAGVSNVTVLTGTTLP